MAFLKNKENDMKMNLDGKLTLLISLWVLDKLIMLAMFLWLR